MNRRIGILEYCSFVGGGACTSSTKNNNNNENKETVTVVTVSRTGTTGYLTTIFIFYRGVRGGGGTESIFKKVEEPLR
jgi:hypothetical protein